MTIIYPIRRDYNNRRISQIIQDKNNIQEILQNTD